MGSSSQSSGGRQDLTTEKSFKSGESQDLLKALTSGISNNFSYQDSAVGQMMQRLTGNNQTNVDGLINASNNESASQFQNNLAQLRAQGYRGGTAKNLFNQGQLSSQFANRQASNNAALRYQAGNDDRNYGLQQASGLNQFQSGNNMTGTQLLDMLSASRQHGISSGSSTSTPSTLSTIGAGLGAAAALAAFI